MANLKIKDVNGNWVGIASIQGEPGPKGEPGPTGKDGATPTFEVGTVTTGEANVEMVEEDNHYTLNFTFPAGGGTSTEELDPTVPDYVKNITNNQIIGWDFIVSEFPKLREEVYTKYTTLEYHDSDMASISATFGELAEMIPVSTSQLENDSGFVTTSEYETISGKWTFSKLPESSQTPTTDNQLVNKAYVDNAIASIINGDEVSY